MEKVEEIIEKVYCDKCNSITTFKFIGKQETLDEPLLLYNCQNKVDGKICGCTKSLDYIFENINKPI